MQRSGPVFALASAALFGISPVLAKLVIGEMSAALLAGLLYLGSGLGLLAFLPWKTGPFRSVLALSRHQQWKLSGTILLGGVLAPLCLAYGIQLGSAFEVSLLLNLETVATTIIAWLLFREHVGAQVWLGKAFLVAGAILLSVVPSGSAEMSLSSLFVAAACLFWGFDNNLTRDLEELPPATLAAIKGLAAGSFNILLAAAIAPTQSFTAMQVGLTLVIGAFSYGVSLVLFVHALRLVGASRTSTYFAAGPFFGVFFSVVFLGERPTLQQWLASLAMAAGLWILFRERHEHAHEHDLLAHEHPHRHDDGHHDHEHPESHSAGETHSHEHHHRKVVHSHPHLPDIHHRHGHQH